MQESTSTDTPGNDTTGTRGHTPESRDLKPGDVIQLRYTEVNRRRKTERPVVCEPCIISSRKDDDSGWWLVGGGGIADGVFDTGNGLLDGQWTVLGSRGEVPAVDPQLKVQLLTGLNIAHNALTDRIPSGTSLTDPSLLGVLDAIDNAIVTVHKAAGQ